MPMLSQILIVGLMGLVLGAGLVWLVGKRASTKEFALLTVLFAGVPLVGYLLALGVHVPWRVALLDLAVVFLAIAWVQRKWGYVGFAQASLVAGSIFGAAFAATLVFL